MALFTGLSHGEVAICCVLLKQKEVGLGGVGNVVVDEVLNELPRVREFF